MIQIEGLTYRPPNAATDLFANLDLSIAEGELALLIGPTGSGKSTLLGVINNLVPRATGGRRVGRVTIGGIDVSMLAPRELADRVGWVGQDPLAGFVTDTVEEELAYTMEQLGIAPAAMRARVEETLDLLGIAELRHRPLRTLSGGEQQRVAIGSVLTARPQVLLLDEPTSALDPLAAEEVISLVRRLVHDLGTTVVLAEHRTERVVEHADSIIELAFDGLLTAGDPRQVMAGARLVPPLVELGRRLRWQPLPLNIRDGRRAAQGLRKRLLSEQVAPTGRPADRIGSQQQVGLQAHGIVVRYGRTVAVRGVDLDLPMGQVAALMGRNGSGKSSLLWALHGAEPPAAGSVRAVGKPREPEQVALVPQTPTDLLYLPTVAEECAEADLRSAAAAGTTAATLRQLVGEVSFEAHPRDLSEGQQLALVLALQLASDAPVVLLDEPTRGLDQAAKDRLADIVQRLAEREKVILIATHDVEFVARTCHRVLVMAEGDIVADGSARSVLVGSPLLAPQVAKVMSPLPYLLVEEVVSDDRVVAEQRPKPEARDV